MDFCKERILSEDYRDIPLDFDVSPDSLFPGDLKASDYCSIEVSDRLYILYVNAKAVPPLGSAEYRYRYIPKCYGLQNDLSPLNESGILQVNNPPLSLTGKGVLLGFLDTGIRYKLPAFLNEDKSTRLVAVWDQTTEPEERGLYASPSGFYYGTEYRQEDINRNLRENGPLLFTDENGHGTKLISAACGYDRSNGFVGAAPDADIAVVKLKECKEYLREYYGIKKNVVCYQETDLMLALRYLDQLATQLSKPLVICFCLGTTMGAHDGSGLLNEYLDSLAKKRNRCVVVAGGNEGNEGRHYEGNFSLSLLNNENYEEIELLIGENVSGFYMEIWGQIPGLYTISLTAPGGETIEEVPYRQGNSAEYDFIYSNTRIVIDYVLVDLGNGQELITVRFQNPLAGIWKIRVFSRNGTGKIHSWLPLKQFLTEDAYFLRPSPYETIVEPAYSTDVLAVSTYSSYNESFYLNSGRGFSTEGRIVPAIAAPGVEIGTVLGQETGASMAAALSVGAAADFMEWAVVEGRNIVINTPVIKSFFIRGAKRQRGLIYPSREWGYGTLNLQGVFDVLAGL